MSGLQLEGQTSQNSFFSWLCLNLDNVSSYILSLLRNNKSECFVSNQETGHDLVVSSVLLSVATAIP